MPMDSDEEPYMRVEDEHLSRRPSDVFAPSRVGDLKSEIADAVRNAIGKGAGEATVQMARGGGATNHSDTTVNIETLEIHIHENDE